MAKREEEIEKLQVAAIDLICLLNSPNTLFDEGIFRIPGAEETIEKAMGKIEKGLRVPEFLNDSVGVDEKKYLILSIHDKASLLKRIIRQLHDLGDPLFTIDQFEALKQLDVNAPDFAKKVGNSLIGTHYLRQKTVINLFSLLNKISKKGELKMDAANLAKVFAPIVIEGPGVLEGLSEKIDFVQNLIENSPIQDPKERILFSTHYKHFTETANSKRHHAFDVDGSTFKDLDNDLKGYKGDYLKSKILLNFKKEIERTTSRQSLDRLLKEDLEKRPEYQVLRTGQDLTTRCLGFFGLKTSSIKALEEMIKEQQRNFEIESTYKI